MDLKKSLYTYRINNTAKEIESIINQRVNVFYIGFPKSGIKRTILESFTKLGHLDLLTIIDVSLITSEDVSTHLNNLFSKNQNSSPTFFLIENLSTSSKEGNIKYELIEKLRKEHQKNTNLIYHFNTNPFWYGIPESSRQLYYFPISSIKEFPILVDFFQNRFGKKTPINKLGELYQLTGGHPYLTKKIFELDLETSSKDVILKKLAQVGKSLLDKLPITEIIRLKNINDQDIEFVNHYLKLGIIDDNNKIKSQVLSHALTDFSSTQQFDINITDQKICLGDININSYFAPHEQKLLFVMAHSQIISRDDLIEICWPKSSQVISDSAIDKLISRLRKKFTDIGLPTSFISTSRGRGYRLNYDST